MIYQLGMQIDYSYKLLFSFWVIFPITIVNELENEFWKTKLFKQFL